MLQCVLEPMLSYNKRTHSIVKEHTLCPLTQAFFSAYFSIVNPLVEEWFWRVFLPHAIGFSERSLWVCVCVCVCPSLPSAHLP